MSMNSSSSANSTISSYFAASSARVRPAASPPSTTFWRPVSLRLKPTPSESSVLTRPLTSTRPLGGAGISRMIRWPRPRRSSVLRSVGAFSSDARYVTETSSTRMRTRSEPDSELTLPGDEEQGAGDEEGDAPRGAEGEVAGRRRDALVEDVAPGRQQRGDRVGDEQEVVAVRNLPCVVEDRRAVEPDPQRVVEELLQVAEVDLTGGDE